MWINGIKRNSARLCHIFFFGILYWVRECVCERRVFSLFARVFLLIEQKLFLFCFSRFLFSFCFCLETLNDDDLRSFSYFDRPSVIVGVAQSEYLDLHFLVNRLIVGYNITYSYYWVNSKKEETRNGWTRLAFPKIREINNWKETPVKSCWLKEEKPKNQLITLFVRSIDRSVAGDFVHFCVLEKLSQR